MLNLKQIKDGANQAIGGLIVGTVLAAANAVYKFATGAKMDASLWISIAALLLVVAGLVQLARYKAVPNQAGERGGSGVTPVLSAVVILQLLTLLGTYQSSRPWLSGEITGFQMGAAVRTSPSEPQRVQGMILLTLANSGGPSMAWHYKARVESPTLKPIPLELIPPVGDKTILTDWDTKKQYALSTKGDLLGMKTPIPTGGGFDGYIMYSLEGVLVDQLNKPGVELVITFEDVLGREFEVRRSVTESDFAAASSGIFPKSLMRGVVVPTVALSPTPGLP